MSKRQGEQLPCRLLAAWLLLVGGVLLAQVCLATRLSYWLLVAVALGSPAVVLLLLWLMGWRLRAGLHRLRAWRRASSRRRQRPADAWPPPGAGWGDP